MRQGFHFYYSLGYFASLQIKSAILATFTANIVFITASITTNINIVVNHGNAKLKNCHPHLSWFGKVDWL